MSEKRKNGVVNVPPRLSLLVNMASVVLLIGFVFSFVTRSSALYTDVFSYWIAWLQYAFVFEGILAITAIAGMVWIKRTFQQVIAASLILTFVVTFSLPGCLIYVIAITVDTQTFPNELLIVLAGFVAGIPFWLLGLWSPTPSGRDWIIWFIACFLGCFVTIVHLFSYTVINHLDSARFNQSTYHLARITDYDDGSWTSLSLIECRTIFYCKEVNLDDYSQVQPQRMWYWSPDLSLETTNQALYMRYDGERQGPPIITLSDTDQ